MARRGANPESRLVTELGISAVDQAKLDEALKDIPGAVGKARAAAINRTLGKARTKAIGGLTRFLNIKRADIAGGETVVGRTAGRVFIKKAQSKHKNPYGRLRIYGRGLQLIQFKNPIDTRDTGERMGVRVMVEKGKIAKTQPHAFIANNPDNSPRVYARVHPERLPIARQYSESLYDLFKRSGVEPEVLSLIQSDLPKQLDSQIDRFLKIKRK